MTEKRKQYLTGISKEERAIRKSLKRQKKYLKICKSKILYCNCLQESIWYREQINETLANIKRIRKQLPAPIKEQMYYYVKVFNCPICDSALDTCAENYCWKCGQRLR